MLGASCFLGVFASMAKIILLADIDARGKGEDVSVRSKKWPKAMTAKMDVDGTAT